ncbi:MAG: hypothetical protein ACK5Q1_01380 [Limnobacter sp.]
MDDFANKSFEATVLSEVDAKREWFVGVLGAPISYGLLLWLL